MSERAEAVGELVAAEISAATDTANENAEARENVAAALIEGFQETERGKEIAALREEIAECRETIREQGNVSEALALALTEMQAKMDLLIQLQPSPQPDPPPNPQESEPPAPEPMAPEAPPPNPPQSADPEDRPAKRRKGNWI